jgi:hypothetical protein
MSNEHRRQMDKPFKVDWTINVPTIITLLILFTAGVKWTAGRVGDVQNFVHQHVIMWAEYIRIHPDAK